MNEAYRIILEFLLIQLMRFGLFLISTLLGKERAYRFLPWVHGMLCGLGATLLATFFLKLLALPVTPFILFSCGIITAVWAYIRGKKYGKEMYDNWSGPF